MKRLPKACTEFGKLTDAKLITRGFAVVNGMTGAIGIYPNPPILPADLEGYVLDFQAASAAAVNGKKNDTQAKAYTKNLLLQVLRANATYVNQVIQREYTIPDENNIQILRFNILQSGFEVSKRVGRPNTLGNAKAPITISALAKTKGKSGTNVNGVLKIRVQIPVKYEKQAIKTWWLQYRLKATPANPWSDFHSTTTRIQVTGLDPGKYEYMVAGVPGIFMGKDQLNWSTIQETVVT